MSDSLLGFSLKSLFRLFSRVDGGYLRCDYGMFTGVSADSLTLGCRKLTSDALSSALLSSIGSPFLRFFRSLNSILTILLLSSWKKPLLGFGAIGLGASMITLDSRGCGTL